MKQLLYGIMLGIYCTSGMIVAKNVAIQYFTVDGRYYFVLDNKNQLFTDDAKPAPKVPSINGNSTTTYNLYKLNQKPNNFDPKTGYLKYGYVNINYIDNKVGTTSSAQKLLEDDGLELIAKKLGYKNYKQLGEEEIKIEEQVMAELAKLADQIEEENELKRLEQEAKKEQLKEEKEIDKEFKKIEKQVKREQKILK